MSETENSPQPPPYAGTPTENPVGGIPPNYGGQPQTNYGYAGHPQQPGYPPPQQHPYPYFVQPAPQQQQQQQQQQQTNIVITQAGAGGTVYQSTPVDYTTQAILACIFCFWPTGLVAIMKASESRDALARGDDAGAHAAANSARQMIRISILVGIIVIVLIILSSSVSAAS